MSGSVSSDVSTFLSSLSLKFMAVTTVNRNEQEADLLPHTQGLKMNLICDEESLTYTQGLPI